MSEIICLRDYPDVNEANIAKSYLIDNGITADIFGAGTPLLGGPFNRFRLMVKEEDKDAALELLKQIKE